MVSSRPLMEKAGYLEKDAWDLIADAQSGNQAAFEEIYRTHVGRVYAICLRILADRSWADDVAQQIFFRAWIKLHSFRGESSFSSWLYRLAINMIMGELKSTNRGNAPVPENEHIISSPHVEFAHNLKLDLEKAITLLPKQARAVFVLHDLEGWKHVEIAEAMGVAVGTCRAQLARARGILREVLGS